MNCLPDAFRVRHSLRGTSSSKIGCSSTCILVSLILWLYIPLTIYNLQGKYYQFLYSVQQPTYDRINIPQDFRLALTFYNKTSNSVANHTILKTIATFKTFINDYLGIINQDGVLSCDPQYFSNTINPITLQDCFTFPSNVYIDLSFYQQVQTSFGFTASFSCSNPFNCSTSNAFYTNSSNNFKAVFANYSFIIYFTSRILTQNAQFQDQVFGISSNDWNTPFTTTANVLIEVASYNVTIDDSIKPWRNNRTMSYAAWQGVSTGSAITNTNSFTSPPKVSVISGTYQTQVVRYYEKIDKLLAMIGGGIFLAFIIFYLPLNYLNQCFSRMNTA